MQDGVIDIINRAYCYDETCEPLAIQYRYCVFSSKAKDSEMREKCANIMREYRKCKAKTALITNKVK